MIRAQKNHNIVPTIKKKKRRETGGYREKKGGGIVDKTLNMHEAHRPLWELCLLSDTQAGSRPKLLDSVTVLRKAICFSHREKDDKVFFFGRKRKLASPPPPVLAVVAYVNGGGGGEGYHAEEETRKRWSRASFA